MAFSLCRDSYSRLFPCILSICPRNYLTILQMDPAVQNTLNRISNWVDHAGPAIDNLPQDAPLTLLAVVAFNNTMDALPVPAIDPLRILALVPPPHPPGRAFARGWVIEEAAIANDNSYYHVTEQQHGRGRFRMLLENDFQGQQHALDAIRIVLREARWIVDNRAQAGALAAGGHAHPAAQAAGQAAAPHADGGLGDFEGAAAAMAAHNAAQAAGNLGFFPPHAPAQNPNDMGAFAAAAPGDHDDDVVPMDTSPDGSPSRGGRRSRRNRTQKRKKSRRSTSGRKRRRTRGAKHRKKSRHRRTRKSK